MEKLNIHEFDKHQVDGVWTHTDINGNSVSI
jgi:hypothetical protein